MLSERIEQARDFIWRNARLIERYRFAFHFDGGFSDAVATALSAYRNTDGGYGNALEPDKRDPHSRPVDVQTALEILDETGHIDPDANTRRLRFSGGDHDTRRRRAVRAAFGEFLSARAMVECEERNPAGLAQPHRGKHLDALANRQQEDGGWPISWQPISKAVEVQWRGIVTIGALRSAYGWNA